MDQAFHTAIESGQACWAIVFFVPAPARSAPVAAAFRRLAARILPEARLEETAEGLIAWGPGEAEPPAAGRLAARLIELVPEATAPPQRHMLPGASSRLAALVHPAASWPAEADIAEPTVEALVAMRRTLAALPAEAWIRRVPIVSLRPGVKARVAARRLVPDPAVLARALGGSWQERTPGEATARLLEPLMLAAAARHLSGEERLVLRVFPEAALGGAYDSLEVACGRAGVARIVPAVGLADAVAAPAAFAAARARFAADGQRMLISCPGVETLGLLAGVAAPQDLVSLSAAAAIAAERSAPGTIPALGPARILLGGCRSEADIAFGLGHGIGLFEGSVVETLLAARAVA
ncbi:MAG: hypothetical protein MUC64_09835 [Rubritepida sp.]|jgi:hypothetical protein|nr:hypothetical protein [Rubritepida sp.]